MEVVEIDGKKVEAAEGRVDSCVGVVVEVVDADRARSLRHG